MKKLWNCLDINSNIGQLYGDFQFLTIEKCWVKKIIDSESDELVISCRNYPRNLRYYIHESFLHEISPTLLNDVFGHTKTHRKIIEDIKPVLILLLQNKPREWRHQNSISTCGQICYSLGSFWVSLISLIQNRFHGILPKFPKFYRPKI